MVRCCLRPPAARDVRAPAQGHHLHDLRLRAHLRQGRRRADRRPRPVALPPRRRPPPARRAVLRRADLRPDAPRQARPPTPRPPEGHRASRPTPGSASCATRSPTSTGASACRSPRSSAASSPTSSASASPSSEKPRRRPRSSSAASPRRGRLRPDEDPAALLARIPNLAARPAAGAAGDQAPGLRRLRPADHLRQDRTAHRDQRHHHRGHRRSAPQRRRPPGGGLERRSKGHSGGGIRTRDLRVMSPTSYLAAPPRDVDQRGIPRIRWASGSREALLELERVGDREALPVVVEVGEHVDALAEVGDPRPIVELGAA